MPPGPGRQVIRHQVNRGKGCALRSGMAVSQGAYAMFTDSGSCIPFENAVPGLDMLRSGDCEIAHGSRYHPSSRIARRHSWHRQVMSRVFRFAVPRVLGLGSDFTDTQCGFKLYRGDVARELYERCVSDGFMFDVEVILRARQKGYRIAEFPVQWTSDRDTRFPPVLGSVRSLRELLAIKRSLARN
jgi:dolichyl-phosphate beta-glucosyltransferase